MSLVDHAKRWVAIIGYLSGGSVLFILGWSYAIYELNDMWRWAHQLWLPFVTLDTAVLDVVLALGVLMTLICSTFTCMLVTAVAGVCFMYARRRSENPKAIGFIDFLAEGLREWKNKSQK